MSEHTAENDATDQKIAHAESVLGVSLLPWQRTYMRAVLNGERVVAIRGRKVGWTTVQRAIECVLPPAEPCTPESPSCEAHQTGRSWLLTCPIPPGEPRP